MTGPKEQQWIDEARKGSQAAFEELVRLYEKRVLALTQRMCKHPEDAAEAAQEAFFAAWRGLEAFRGESSFSTWLYRLASNACVDLLRRERKRQGEMSLDDADWDIPGSIPSPQEEAERRELGRQIEAGLQALPPEYREVLVLREIQQLRYDEIARVLGVDMGTVKSRISRGRKRLRGFLLASGNFSPPPPSKETGKEGRQ